MRILEKKKKENSTSSEHTIALLSIKLAMRKNTERFSEQAPFSTIFSKRFKDHKKIL